MANIAVFGFDKLGFDLRKKSLSSNGNEYTFIEYSDGRKKLNDFDGVILPTGIFETIQEKHDYLMAWQDATYDRSTILVREKEVLNLLADRRKWVVFLSSQITWHIIGKGYQTIDLTPCDLSKRLLKLNQTTSDPIQAYNHLTHKRVEFETYTKRYGTAENIFNSSNEDFTPLITIKDNVVGFSIRGQIFVLPFHTNDHSSDGLCELSIIVAESVGKYSNNKEQNIPDWVNEVTFSAEDTLLSSKLELEDKLHTIEQNILKFKKYKSTLASTGEYLANSVADILTDFFNLKLNTQDNFEEDLSILNDSDELLAIVEVKGVTTAIKRDHITKTEQHRSANDLPHEFPAILIINDNSTSKGFSDRKSIPVADDILKYSTGQNVKVLRTCTLLDLMLNFESLPKQTRKEKFLEFFISSSGGIVKIQKGQLTLDQKR